MDEAHFLTFFYDTNQLKPILNTMKQTLITLAAALLTAATATAQNLTNTIWTSLEEEIEVESDDGTNIKAIGVDYHTDGGFPFGIKMKRISSNVFEVKYIDAEDSKNTLRSVDCPKTGKTEYLYQESMDGKFMHILVKNDGKEYCQMQEFYDVLNGTYTDKDGKKYVFDNNTLTIDGKKMTIRPEQSNYDGYRNCFSIIDGDYYCFAISETGINIYTAADPPDDCSDCDYYPDKLWVKLRADLNVNQGRWMITNQKILMERYLLRFPKSMLRLMRNEIYARHGYKFASADLTAYFSKTSWYHPGTDNSKIKLSPLEQLNVNIIKKIEDRLGDDYNKNEIEEGL